MFSDNSIIYNMKTRWRSGRTSAPLGIRSRRFPALAGGARVVGGALNALNSNARNAILSQSFSRKRKCLITSARESL